MAAIRPAGASRRRARVCPAPTGRAGTAQAPRIAAEAPGRSARRCLPRIAAAVGAGAALAAAGVAERPVVAASFTLLGHVRWLWVLAAIVLESASMAAFAIMQRRLLAAGGASVGIRPMLATTYAANAVSVSVPLAGPERPRPSPSADSPGRAQTPPWPAGRCWPAGWSPRRLRPSSRPAPGWRPGKSCSRRSRSRAACSPQRSSSGSRPPRAGQNCAARSNEAPHGYHDTRAVCCGAPSAIPDRPSGPGLSGWARSSFPYRAG